MFPFVTLKVFTFQILVELILIFWLALIIFYKEARPKLNLLTIVFAAFLVILFVASALGIDFNRSLWSTIERQNGLFFLAHLFVFFLILSEFFRNKWINIKNYFLTSFLISLVVAAFSFVQRFDPSFFFVTSGERPGSFLGNPIFLAAYLLFHVFIGLYLLTQFPLAGRQEHKSVSKIFYLIGILFLVVAIFSTETRGALIGLGAGILFLLIYFSIFGSRASLGKPGFLRLISIAILVLIVLLSTIFIFTREAPIWQKLPGFRRVATFSFSNLLTSGEFTPRLLSWNIALKSFSERPILGWGFENFKYPFDKNFNPTLLRFGFGETYWDKPHNVFLEYLATGGAIGFLAYLSIFAVVFYLLFRKTRINTDEKRINADASKNIGINQLESALINGRAFIAAALIAYLVQNATVFDTFGSYLVLAMVLALISSNFGVVHRLVQFDSATNQRNVQLSSAVGKIVFTISAFFLIFLIFINFKTLYANKTYYWSVNYFLNNMPEAAIESFKKSVGGFNPYASEVRRTFAANVANIYRQNSLPEPEKNVRFAIGELQKAIKEKKNDFWIRTNMAEIAAVVYPIDAGYLDLGEEASREAAVLSPNRQEIYFNWAKTRLLKGEKKEALELIKKALELDPMVGVSHFYYAILSFDSGDYETGVRELKRAEELGRYPNNLKEARSIADYLADFEDYKGAIDYYKRALDFEPKDSDSHYKLGIVLYFEKNYEEAKNHFLEALEINPEIRKSPFYSQTKPILNELNID